MKTCIKCNLIDTKDKFASGKNVCKICMRKLQKEWRLKNPESLTKYAVKRNFDISLEEYKTIFKQNNYQCAICKATRNKGYKNYKLAIDHDHKTGKIRGVLCFPCNKALGFMEDDIERLKNAISYLGLSKLSPTKVKTARINIKASESEPYIRP